MWRAWVLGLVVVAAACGGVSGDPDAGGGDPHDGTAADGTAGPPDARIVYDAPPDATPCPAEPCRDGLACTHNAGCTSGNCECTDAECTVRVCAPADCPCGYGEDGACTGQLTPGTEDPEDCEDPTACYRGACLAKPGETCTTNDQCGSGQCECTDATCTARACADADCVCQYGSAGACTATLNAGTADPEDCEGTNACFAGACKKVTGESCVANSECGSEQCECTNFGCSTRVCAASSCTCKYGPAGGCASNLGNATDDPEDCASTGQSCYDGACRGENLATGTSCVDDRQCATLNCECTDATCSVRQCAAISCTCRYQSNPASAICYGVYITDGYTDPTDCSGRVGCGLTGFDIRSCVCNGAGSCVIHDPVLDPG